MGVFALRCHYHNIFCESHLETGQIAVAAAIHSLWIRPTVCCTSLKGSTEHKCTSTSFHSVSPRVTLAAHNVCVHVVSTYLKAWYRCPPHLWSQHSRPFLRSHSEEGEKKEPRNIKSQWVIHKRDEGEELTRSSRIKRHTDITDWVTQTAFNLEVIWHSTNQNSAANITLVAVAYFGPTLPI